MRYYCQVFERVVLRVHDLSGSVARQLSGRHSASKGVRDGPGTTAAAVKALAGASTTKWKVSGHTFCLQLCDQPAHPRYGKPGGFGDRSLCMPAVAIREKNGFVTFGFAKVIRKRPCCFAVLRAGYFAAWFGDDACLHALHERLIAQIDLGSQGLVPQTGKRQGLDGSVPARGKNLLAI